VDTAPTSPPATSPKQEPRRKHSLTAVFSKKKKDKDEPISPRAMSPTDDSTAPVTSPTYNKERRGSAFSRLFSSKKHEDSDSKKSSNKVTVNNRNISTEIEKVSVSSKAIPAPVIEQENESKIDDKNNETPNSSLLVPAKNEAFGSSESLYDENDNGESSVRRMSRNKERIRNRKLARKEAADRHKSLPAGLGDVEIDVEKGIAVPVSNNNNNETSNKESPSIIDATPRTRKKHRARRANTEFLGNVPLISVEQSSPMVSKDDGSVNRRGRRTRRDRPKTLTNGIDSDIFNDGDGENGDGVVNENLSFADIKKKLLEGLTDDKKIPEKIPQKERQKIKRTKSTKRFKTITEGIAPRDLELARQAIEAEKAKDENGTSRNTIDKDTLAQITAALTSAGDKRKSFIVESRPASRYQSNEDLRISDDDDKRSKDDSAIKPEPAPSKRMLQRTKSMTTIHLNMTAEPDEEDPEIKPLSELKNRFLQAMEDTKHKHLQNKSPVNVKRRAKRDRKDRPHTICGIDQFTMDQLQDDITGVKQEQVEKDNWVMDQVKNEINEVKKREEANNTAKVSTPSIDEKPKKKEKKKYARANSEKIFDDVFDDIDDILNDGKLNKNLLFLIPRFFIIRSTF